MLNPWALANAFALATVILYGIIYLLRFVAAPFFKLIVNSSFFGADIASQVPKLTLANLLGVLIISAVISWSFGYLTATIYNRYAKTH